MSATSASRQSAPGRGTGDLHRPLRILLLVPYEGLRGPLPKILPLLAGAFRRSGCTVRTAPWSRRVDDETAARRAMGRLADLLRIRTALRSEPFDVFFVTTAHDWTALLRDIPLLIATRGLSGRVVVQFHGSSSDWLVADGRRLFKAATRLLLRLCDVVLVLSQEERREWLAFSPRSHFEVVANPFQPEPEAPPLDGADRHTATAEPLVVFVGRLQASKGVFDLIDAMAELRATTPCRLVIAGDGPDAAAAREKVATLRLGDRVDLVGYLAGAELRRLYRDADVFALPTYHAEGFPTVVLEAMNEGLPIVTTRLRGAADALVEGRNALFVPAHSPALVAVALRRLLDDPGLRADIGCNNREKVKEFAPDVVITRYLAAIRRDDAKEPA